MPKTPLYRADIGEEEVEAVTRMLRSGKLGQGEVVAEFEKAFARYIGTRHAVAVNSGTAALHIALLAHGIGPIHEAITSALSPAATTDAIVHCGATPVLADIDAARLTLDLAAAEAAVSPKTRVLVPVHLFGCPCDMGGLMDIARRHRLDVIEDACAAHGAECCGRKVGSFGTGCFSFGKTANMTMGEGGMLTTDSACIASTARDLRDNSGTRVRLTYHDRYSYRMTDVAAAIGLCQLNRLEHYIALRIDNARLLTEELRGILGLATPTTPPRMRHVFQEYTVRVCDDFAVTRDVARQRLWQRGIESGVLCAKPAHHQPCYRAMGFDSHRLPVAESRSRDMLALPLYPSLTTNDISTIAAALRAIGNAS